MGFVVLGVQPRGSSAAASHTPLTVNEQRVIFEWLGAVEDHAQNLPKLLSQWTTPLRTMVGDSPAKRSVVLRSISGRIRSVEALFVRLENEILPSLDRALPGVQKSRFLSRDSVARKRADFRNFALLIARPPFLLVASAERVRQVSINAQHQMVVLAIAAYDVVNSVINSHEISHSLRSAVSVAGDSGKSGVLKRFLAQLRRDLDWFMEIRPDRTESTVEETQVPVSLAEHVQTEKDQRRRWFHLTAHAGFSDAAVSLSLLAPWVAHTQALRERRIAELAAEGHTRKLERSAIFDVYQVRSKCAVSIGRSPGLDPNLGLSQRPELD